MTHYDDTTGYTEFCFNRFGDEGRKVQYIIGSMYVTSDNSFDKMGRPNELSEPKGTMVYYTRDGIGRITGIQYKLSGQTSNTTLISNVSYLPFGPASSITYGTGSSARTLSRSYDKDYVISSVKDPGTDGLDLNYSRDVLGNLTQIANTAGTAGNIYTYDLLNRLTTQTDLGNNPVSAYTYDSTGNRTSKTTGGTTRTYTYYPSTSHWLYNVGDGSGNRTYNANGSTTGNGNGLTWTYQDTGRIGEVYSGGTEIKLYDYDARGERVRKTLPSDTSQSVKTVFDEQGHILGDFSYSNAIIDETIWMDDLPVGVVNGTSGTVNYIEPDHLGTPRAVIDPSRNLAVWRWPILNDPFGETSPNGDPDGDGTTYTLNLRFPGQEWDAESGLTYNYQRDFESNTGRYAESDPIGMAGGISTYSYATDSPVSFFDKEGRLPGEEFASPGDALLDAQVFVRKIVPARARQLAFVEWGGWVFPKGFGADGGPCYSYNAVPSNDPEIAYRHIPTAQLMAIEPGNAILGWHSHPDLGPPYDKGDNEFSDGDYGFADFSHLPFYLIEPAGPIIGYGPGRTPEPPVTSEPPKKCGCDL